MKAGNIKNKSIRRLTIVVLAIVTLPIFIIAMFVINVIISIKTTVHDLIKIIPDMFANW